MDLLRLVARPMLSAVFVTGGAQQLTDPGAHLAPARTVTEPLLDEDASSDLRELQLVQLNGLAQVVGGLLLATGRLPRLAALLLAGSLVPTTLAAHRFWEEDDPAARQEQQVHFVKNISLLGGLLIATTDRGGAPSLAWRAEHAAEDLRLRKELAKERLTPDVLDAKRLVDAVRDKH